MSFIITTTSELKQDFSSLSVVIIVTLLLTFPTGGYCVKSQNESLPLVIDQSRHIDTCPPWYVQQRNVSSCYCHIDHDPKGIVYQYENHLKCLKENDTSHSLLLQTSFCMTFDSESNETLLVNCPYDTVHGHELHRFYVIINSSVSNLNNFTCSPLKRQEKNCHKCIDGFGPSPYTLDLSCFNCSARYRGWMLYFTLEFIPLTVFFIVITVLRIRPAQGYLNSFILFSQLVVAAFSFSSQVPFIYSMGKMSKVSLVLVRILQTLYGFWNLDFFRYAIPGFCVSSKLNNLDVLSLQLISVFYPMSLILVAWIVIHLYERNFKPFVWAWRPFRRCLSHFSVTNNPKRAVVNLFTMFLLLSYSKLLFVAVNLLNTTGVYRFNPFNNNPNPVHHDKATLFLDPNMHYFSPDHARYVVLSVFLFAVFILPPPIILLLYPTKWFQTFLNNCCPKSGTIRMFAHACHGCFKNGLNGTRDCRHFAGAYLLLRIALFLCKTAICNFLTQWIMVAFCFVVATFMIGLYRPYKNPYLSALDFTFMLCFSIASLFTAFVTTNNNPTKDDGTKKLISVVFGFIFLTALLPLVYISCLVIYHCKRKCKKVKHFLISRRRDYLDISDFQYDPDQENSDNMEHGQAASILRSRVLNSDSFQSE